MRNQTKMAVTGFLGIEYAEIPKAHLQTFDHELLTETTHLLVHPLFEINEYRLKEDKRQLRLMMANIKRDHPFVYEL